MYKHEMGKKDISKYFTFNLEDKYPSAKEKECSIPHIYIYVIHYYKKVIQ